VTLFDWAETATATLPPREVPSERKPLVKDAVIFRRQDGSTTAYLRRDWTESEVERLREMDEEGKSNRGSERTTISCGPKQTATVSLICISNSG
jgi:hypothetical protein